jgi:hypothetical protein
MTTQDHQVSQVEERNRKPLIDKIMSLPIALRAAAKVCQHCGSIGPSDYWIYRMSGPNFFCADCLESERSDPLTKPTFDREEVKRLHEGTLGDFSWCEVCCTRVRDFAPDDISMGPPDIDFVDLNGEHGLFYSTCVGYICKSCLVKADFQEFQDSMPYLVDLCRRRYFERLSTDALKSVKERFEEEQAKMLELPPEEVTKFSIEPPSWHVNWIDGSEYENRDAKLYKLALPDQHQRKIFRKEGEFYTIIYLNKTPLRLAMTRGLKYLHYLVHHREEKFESPQELEVAVMGHSEIPDSQGQMSPEEALDTGLNFQPGRVTEGTSSPQDRSMTEAAEQEIRGLIDDMGEARRRGDLAQVELLTQQVTAAHSQLEDLQKSARLKGWDEANEACRQRIWIAIDRALQKLAEHNEDLADHLRDSVTPFSPPYQYHPNDEIVWWE